MNLNVLFIEDNENELFNIIRVLKKSGVNLNHHVLVDCAEDLINALKSDVKWDVILSDFNIPGFGGEQALEICNTASGDIPFILVSGIVGEETAVSLIKSGAKDYVMKDNLSRLPESIKREIKDAQLIKERNDLIIKSNKLSQIVESSHDIILNFDKEYTITYFNKEADVVFKFSNSNQISLAQIIDQDWDNFFQTKVLVDLNKWGVWKGELYFKTSELTDLPVIASIVQHQKSEFNEFSLIAIDITERKAHEKEIIEFNTSLEETVKIRTAELEKSKKELEKSILKEKSLNELKSRFVSTASHQFRTPLTVIQSNVGLLEMQMEKLDIHLLSKVIKRIKGEVVRMTNIIEEVLTLSKINSGKIVPNIQNYDLIKICKGIITKHNEIQEDNRTIDLKVVGKDRQIKLDKYLFEQAFSNAISNALKYSKNRPTPEVTITFNDEICNILIRDFGVGIPKQDLENLFTPFFRASNVIDLPGTGLGISIMKEYLQLIDAELTLNSIENQGTEINIKFMLHS